MMDNQELSVRFLTNLATLFKEYNILIFLKEVSDMNKILEEYKQLCKDLDQYERTAIPLCAAENYVSNFCMRPLISNFEGKYSFTETSGNNSFIGGEYIERLNILLKKQCQKMFGATYTNTETLTGINCFTVCAMALLSPEDYVLVTTPEQGGHASIPIILDTIGVKYRPIPYDYSKYQINYEKLNQLCKSQKYSYIIFCQSDVINPPDLKAINISNNMGIIYDSTQTLGLIASGVVPNPLACCKNIVLIGGSHKTLPAPSCGLIMTNNEFYEEKLKKQITPNYLRYTQPNHSASLLLALIEQEEYGHCYQKLIVDLANMFGLKLHQLGFKVAKLDSQIFTYTHQLFILMNEEDTNSFYSTARQFNITLNKKHKKLFNNDGIRIGTQQIARYNWEEKEIALLAQLFYSIRAKNYNDIQNIREKLIAKKIPSFTYEDFSIV